MKIISHILLFCLVSVLSINTLHYHTQNSNFELNVSEFEEEYNCELCDVINYSDDIYIINDYVINFENSQIDELNILLNNNGIIGAKYFSNRAPPLLYNS